MAFVCEPAAEPSRRRGETSGFASPPRDGFALNQLEVPPASTESPPDLNQWTKVWGLTSADTLQRHPAPEPQPTMPPAADPGLWSRRSRVRIRRPHDLPANRPDRGLPSPSPAAQAKSRRQPTSVRPCVSAALASRSIRPGGRHQVGAHQPRPTRVGDWFARRLAAPLLVPHCDSDDRRARSAREPCAADVVPMHRMQRVGPSGASVVRPLRSCAERRRIRPAAAAGVTAPAAWETHADAGAPGAGLPRR